MAEKTNKGFWGRIAKLYTPFMSSNRNLYKNICKLIRPCLAPGTRMLELATGPGLLALALGDTGAEITATDYSPQMIAQAQKQACSPNVHFEVADATALPYEDSNFDVVLIANALHIMPAPDKAMAEINRVLRPGGLLVAPTFIHGTGAALRLRVGIMRLLGFKVYHKWDGPQLIEFIAEHGFTIQLSQLLGSNLVPLLYVAATR